MRVYNYITGREKNGQVTVVSRHVTEEGGMSYVNASSILKIFKLSGKGRNPKIREVLEIEINGSVERPPQ